MRPRTVLRNRPTICRIKSADRETKDTSTFKIECPTEVWSNAKPGQFVMVWIPRIDEVPMSISNKADGEIWITVKKVGEATSAIHRMVKGGEVGIRGPYGTSFTTQGGNVLIVAGGIGAAPLLFLTRALLDSTMRITVILGAPTAEKVVLKKDFGEMLSRSKAARQIVTTDDGSLGTVGLASDISSALMEKEKFDRVYTCGPEPMLRKIISKALDSGIQVEASLERYMRCGIGLCGSCHLGKYLVCKDGPVFSNDKLVEVIKYLKAE